MQYEMPTYIQNQPSLAPQVTQLAGQPAHQQLQQPQQLWQQQPLPPMTSQEEVASEAQRKRVGDLFNLLNPSQKRILISHYLQLNNLTSDSLDNKHFVVWAWAVGDVELMRILEAAEARVTL
jgi:hypothetical protein